MNDRITYGVYWRTKFEPNEWRLYIGWFDCYWDAVEEAKNALKNPRSLEVRVVERTETFESLDTWRNEDNDA